MAAVVPERPRPGKRGETTVYAWIFSILPGPKWLRVIETMIVILAVVAALFQWGFPWAVEAFHLSENTVS